MFRDNKKLCVLYLKRKKKIKKRICVIPKTKENFNLRNAFKDLRSSV